MALRPIAIAGPMASGKTTMARALVEKYSVDRLGFGDLVRGEARRLGIPGDRLALQELGVKMLDDHGPQSLVIALLGDQREGLVVDGVRHVRVVSALKDLMPDLLLVSLTAPRDVLDERRRQRDPSASRRELDAHRVEGDIAEIRASSALVIDTSQISLFAGRDAVAAAAAT